MHIDGLAPGKGGAAGAGADANGKNPVGGLNGAETAGGGAAAAAAAGCCLAAALLCGCTPLAKSGSRLGVQFEKSEVLFG